MKTAVEYLYTQLQMNNEILEKGTRVHQEVEKKIFDQAKEIEKQQQELAWKESRVIKVVDAYHEKETSFEDYYNKNFKSEKQ
jgi:hypothetical protein